MSASQRIDLRKEYDAYLARFVASHGDVELGRFVKQGGRLIKKHGFEEFEELYRDYADAAASYLDGMARGDTINDVAVRVIRERASELLLDSPV